MKECSVPRSRKKGLPANKYRKIAANPNYTSVDPKQMEKFSTILYMRTKETRVGDKCGRQVWETSRKQVQTQPKDARVGDKYGKQVGDKCKLMRSQASRVCGRQAPGHPEWEMRVGDKWEANVNSCSPRHPEWEASVEDKCGRQAGDKCRIMRPKTPRVGDKWGRQV